MEFNKYFYHFMCLSADLIYLTWLISGLVDSKMVKQIIYFCSIYIFITLACVIGYFFLGANYAIELGINQGNTAKWLRADLIAIFSAVGVFLAPVAVLLGLHEWKKQKKLVSRIDALEQYKNYISDYNKELISYQMSKFWFNLNYKNEKTNKDNFERFRVNTNKIVITFFHEVMNKKIYFNDSEIDLFEKYINDFYTIIQNLDRAELVVNTIFYGVPRPEILDNDRLQLYKCLYLLDPSCQHIKSNCTSAEDIKALEDFYKEQINNYINVFSEYIDSLLLQAYK
jgi:hypothetical protein